VTIEQSDSLKAERDMYAALKARKEALEEALRRRKEDLRKLCLQEGELTGSLPRDMPLEPGEQAPVFRRRVGTAFSLNVKDDGPDQLSTELSTLELEVDLQGKITSAAQRLAGDKTVSKYVRKQRKLAYTRAVTKLKEMEKKLGDVRRQAGKPASHPRHQTYQGTYNAPSSSPPHTNIDHLLVQLVHEPGAQRGCRTGCEGACPSLEPGTPHILHTLPSDSSSSPGSMEKNGGGDKGETSSLQTPPSGYGSLHTQDLGSCGTSLHSCSSQEEPGGLREKALSTDTGFPDEESPDVSRNTSHSSLPQTSSDSGAVRSESPVVVKRRNSSTRAALRKQPEKSFSYYFDEDNSPNSQSSGVNKKHFVVTRAGDNSRLQELRRDAGVGGCRGSIRAGGASARVIGLALGEEDDDTIDEGSYDMEDEFEDEDDGDSDFEEDNAVADINTEVPRRKKTFFLSKGLKKAVLLNSSKRDSIIDRGYHALERLFMSDPVSPPLARSVRRHRDIVQRHSVYRGEGEAINLSPNPSPKPTRSPKSLSPRFGRSQPSSPQLSRSETRSPDLRYSEARSPTLAHHCEAFKEGRSYKLALSEPSSPNLRASESRSPNLRKSEPRSPQLGKSEQRHSRYAGSDFKNGYEVTVRGQSTSSASSKNSEELNAKIKELIDDSRNLKPLGRSRSVDYTTDLKVNNEDSTSNDDLKLSRSQVRQKNPSSSSPSFRRSFMLFSKRKGNKNKQMKHSTSETQGLGQCGGTSSPPSARLPPTGRRPPPQEVTRFDGDYIKFSLSGSCSGSSEDLSSALMEHYDLRSQDLNLRSIRPPPAAFKDLGVEKDPHSSASKDLHNSPKTSVSRDVHTPQTPELTSTRDHVTKPQPKSRHIYANDPKLQGLKLQGDLQRSRNVPPEPPDKTPKFPLVLPEDLDFTPLSASASWPRRTSQDPNSLAQSENIGYKTVGVRHSKSSNPTHGVKPASNLDNPHGVKDRGVHIHNVKRRAKTGSMLVGGSVAPRAGFDDLNDSKDSIRGKDLSATRRTSWHSQQSSTNSDSGSAGGTNNSVRYFETIV